MNFRSLSNSLLLTVSLMLSGVGQAWASEGGEKPTLFTGDLGNIVWSLVTFFAVVFVLGKFAWKPILGALQKREDFIRDSLQQAKCDREKAEERLKEYTRQLDESRGEASAIVEEGRRDAEMLRRKIEESAKDEAGKLLERAKREIDIATATAVKELYSVGAKLATEVAGRVIQEELDEAKHEKLVRSSLDELARVYRN